MKAYEFKEFRPSGSQHEAGVVMLLRPLTTEEADLDEVGPMWRVMYAVDLGEEFDAFEDELHERGAAKPWPESYEDYLSDEPNQHGIPDGLTREEWAAWVRDHNPLNDKET